MPNIVKKYQEYSAARMPGCGCTICASAICLSFCRQKLTIIIGKINQLQRKVIIESQILKHHYGHYQCQQFKLRPFMTSFLYLLGH